MGIPIFQVDAFTAEAFGGNPAAICLLDTAADAEWMQAVAAEMNLSETAYLIPLSDGYDLRWFTPLREVDLCGHATLASAHVLWEQGRVEADARCDFHTRSGLLTAVKNDGWIRMTFPLGSLQPISPDPRVAAALGITPLRAAANALGYLLFEVENESVVRGLSPDFRTLNEFDHHAYVVTSKSDTPAFDFVSRFFAPRFGIDEDPVTGSAHCILGAYWSEQMGKRSFMAQQASKRGGVIKVEVDAPKVHLSGQAVTVFEGTLRNSTSWI